MSTTKTTCPVSRQQFAQHAQQITVVIDGKPMVATVKEFSTGSVGWNINAKATVMVNGVPCTCQVGMNMTIVGSKDLPKEASTPAVEPATPAATQPGRDSIDRTMRALEVAAANRELAAAV